METRRVDKRSASRGLTLVRSWVLIVVASIIVPLTLIACLAAGWSIMTGVFVAVFVLLLVLSGAMRVIPARLADGRGSYRWLFVVWIALSLFASYRLASMSIFMLDAERVEHAVDATFRAVPGPESKKRQHNCFTSYMIAAHLAAEKVENLYQPNQYYGDPVQETPIHQMIGDTFTIDRYQYPPPFLVLPRLILAASHSFFQARTYWFVLNVIVFVVAVGTLVAWLGRHEFNVYWLAWPLLLAAPAMLQTLQIGNVHFLIVSLSMLALVAFDKKQNWLGGVLLGFAIVTKIFPCVLLAYLLVSRRWHAAIWTIAAIVMFCLTTVLFFGVQPFDSFVNFQVPRLMSGEAFSFATKVIGPITSNLSVVGVSYKLEKLGVLVNTDPATVAGVLKWIYTAILVIVAIAVGVRHRPQGSSIDADGKSRLALAQIWLVLLILGQLRSPFVPWGYGNVAILWLLTLTVLGGEGGLWKKGGLGLGWLVFAVKLPQMFGLESGTFSLLYSLATLLLLFTLCLTIAFRHVQSGPNLIESEQ